MTELSLPVVHSQLTKSQRLAVTQDVLDEINKLAEDPRYGEEFLDVYMQQMAVLENAPNGNHARYVNAVKYFILVESGDSLTDAYIKIFPERIESRRRVNPEGYMKVVNGESSRFNSSHMVSEIRKMATVPVQLIHRHLLHEAILEQAELMRTARSEMVRQKAAATLITELKPTEEQQISVKVDDGSASVIEELRKATEALAISEHQAVMAGVPMRQIAESTIIEVDCEEIDD